MNRQLRLEVRVAGGPVLAGGEVGVWGGARLQTLLDAGRPG
ncbi:MAG: hypothetical protein ACJ742_07445 [Actinomycetes bacterium]